MIAVLKLNQFKVESKIPIMQVQQIKITPFLIQHQLPVIVQGLQIIEKEIVTSMDEEILNGELTEGYVL